MKMKKTASSWMYALIMGLLVFSYSCTKDDSKDDETAKPVLTTVEVSGITAGSAVSGGAITDEGGATITARGVCWSTNQTPTIDDNKTTDGAGAGSFTSQITGLVPSTTYYVRAYATNSGSTGYGSTMSFTTKEGVVDLDGNVYQVVTIGTQTWMAENLKTTKYNDGTNIPLVTDRVLWNALTSPGYCWFDNDQKTYGDTYGALYNWYTVNMGKLCPAGWHIPSKAEWVTLVTYLGGEDNAGGKLKATGTALWQSPNSGATNQSGFTALPAGSRGYSVSYTEMGKFTTYWSTTESLEFPLNAWVAALNYNNSEANIYPYGEKLSGLSVRCIKDY